jgi:hypothetical protein
MHGRRTLALAWQLGKGTSDEVRHRGWLGAEMHTLAIPFKWKD